MAKIGPTLGRGQMQQPLWRGVAVALVTMFDDERRVDAAATAAHARRLVDTGIQAILVAGSTGEAEALTDQERTALIAAVREQCPDVPVIAGASGPWLGAAAARSTAALAAGADAVLVAPPRRCVDTPAFYAGLADAVGTPRLFAYHFPGVAGGEVPLAGLDRLGIAGLKDSTGSAERLIAELEAWDGWTYVGSAMLALTAGALGATGAILAIANAQPEIAIAAFDGKAAAQRELLRGHLSAVQRFPYGLKRLVAERFGTSEVARA